MAWLKQSTYHEKPSSFIGNNKRSPQARKTRTAEHENIHCFPTLVKQRVTNLQAKVNPTTSLGDAITQDIHDDAFPPSDPPNTKTKAIYYKVYSIVPKNLAYTDLTGRFPYRSSRGSQYIMVAYSYDSNAILAKAINNRSAPSHQPGNTYMINCMLQESNQRHGC